MFPIPSIPFQVVFNLTTRLSLPHEDGLQPDNISQFQASIIVIIKTMLDPNEKSIQSDVVLLHSPHSDGDPFYALRLKCKFCHGLQTQGRFVTASDLVQLAKLKTTV